ncbi:MAG: formate dehydrogenase accessory sulfurtransferase FdhD [Anaerolineae bacterium]
MTTFYEEHQAIQVRGNQVISLQDPVCIEDTFRLYLNDIALAQIIASPDQLRELGTGFVICEGLSAQVENVQVSHNEIRVYAKTDAKIDYELRSSGCIGVRGMPKVVSSDLTIAKEDVFRVIGEIESDVWRKTGGVHCSVLFQDGRMLVRSSDIGRHNTIDKIVGFAVMHGINLSQCIIGCTGRQPAGMIAKVANAGIPIIVSKAAATNAGILLADRSNVTLICFARGERFTVYTHPERIREIREKRAAKRYDRT